MQFADRLQNVETSAIRELFKLLGKPGIISFAGGFPDPALFDAVGIAQASAAVLACNPGPVLQYGATEGYGPLREGIAGFMAGKGAGVAPEGLIVTTGSQQALDLLGKTMISPGDKVIVEAPTFLATIQCFRLYGAHIIGAPIDADGVDVDKLEALIEEHKPKLVYLIPTFGNPSGATLSLARRKRILDIAVRTQTLVVEDDPYGELYFDQAPPPSLLALSNGVPGSRDWLAHCGSFSKILSPGLRVGWLIAPSELLAKATMCKQFSDAQTSNLTQAICAHYLTLNRLADTLAVVRKTYAERAAVMAASLRRELGAAIEFNQPQGGMSFWAKLTGADGKSANAPEFARRAIDKGVAFVPGAPFFAHDPDMSALRLSFATADVAKIEEGIGRLGQAL
ncbi:2-aminoadipate transaminase [mine drainage metagenome]|uniref:2-aminoadipate transaminase n=1 Tax=mine drainage metagenome TaxID=410659 RepID=A0A1J5PRJ2_9ZZZZ